MNLIPKIKERRMEVHLTQRDLAKKLKMSPSQLSRLENGVNYPLPQTLWDIAYNCRCKVDDLYEPM